MLSDNELADRIDKLPYPRITPETVRGKIKKVDYLHSGLLTFCILTVENGFQATGQSACAHPGNYDKAIGEKLAYQDAFNKLYLLEGYLLKQRIHETTMRGDQA